MVCRISRITEVPQEESHLHNKKTLIQEINLNKVNKSKTNRNNNNNFNNSKTSKPRMMVNLRENIFQITIQSPRLHSNFRRLTRIMLF